MDYDEVIQKVIANAEIESEVGRKKAYEECIKYADQNLADTFDYNPFIDRAAERLGQVPERKDIARRQLRVSAREKLHLTYSKESGPTLTGNASGLTYLANVLKKLAKARMNGEHSHFYYGEPPLCGNSYPLTVYLEDDEWFAEHTKDSSRKQKDGPPEREPRDIDIDKIAAFLLSNKVPPTLMMTPNKIYRVSSREKYDNQDVWVKKIREESDRVFVFTFERDDGEIQKLGLDLDDQTVIFLTNEDLSQLT